MNYPAAELRGIDKSQVLVTLYCNRTASCSVLCDNKNLSGPYGTG